MGCNCSQSSLLVYQTEASCIRCQNVKNGPYCVSECPLTKYPDDNGICQDCHENCLNHGCTGPLNSVGHGACNACDIAVYDHSRQVSMCLPAESDCEEGFFKHVLLPSSYGAMISKKVRVCVDFFQMSYKLLIMTVS